MPVNQEILKVAAELYEARALPDEKMLASLIGRMGSKHPAPPPRLQRAPSNVLTEPALNTPSRVPALTPESAPALPQTSAKLGPPVYVSGVKGAASNDEQDQDNDEQDKDKNKDTAKNERKQRARNRAEDLLPMKGFGRGYADFVLPSTFGGTRAGRATMIARALGQKPDFSVSNPNTDNLVGSLGGMLAGGIPGALIGAGLGALGDDPLSGALLGGGLGGSAGGLFGVLGAGMNRREKLQEIQDSLANELEQHGTSRLNLKTPQYGRASSLLMPFSGAHRAGQADAYEALKNNTRYAKTPGRTAGYLATHLPYLGPLVNIGQGIGQNFSARKRLKQDQPRQSLADEYGLEEFAAPKFANVAQRNVNEIVTSGSKQMKPLLFGEKVGFLNQMNPAALGEMLKNPAVLGGAGAGTAGFISGLIAPGEYEDADGNVKKRSRIGSALRRALMLGAGGAGAGMAYDYFSPKSPTTNPDLGAYLSDPTQPGPGDVRGRTGAPSGTQV